MLGVFLLPAFTRLGQECQDLLSPCNGIHVCTDETSVYSLIRKTFGGSGVRTHVNSKGKDPLFRKKNLLRGGSNPRRCIKHDNEPKTLPNRYSSTAVAVIVAAAAAAAAEVTIVAITATAVADVAHTVDGDGVLTQKF